MNKNQEIVKTLQEYEGQEGLREKIEYIRQKNTENWDKISGIFPNVTPNMMITFLYEYYNGVYQITDGKVNANELFFKIIEGSSELDVNLKTPIILNEVNLDELRNIVYCRLTNIIVNSKWNANAINWQNNAIVEGINDFISNWVMWANGFSTDNITIPDKITYNLEQEIIKRVFSKRGTQKSITDYIKSPEKVISYFESVGVQEQTFLTYAQDFVKRTQKIEPAIANNLSSNANDVMIKRAYTMLWRDNLEEGQKRLVKYFLAQEIDNCYVGNEDNSKKVTKNEMLNAIDASDEFGMIMNKTFPKSETKEQITLKKTNDEN